MRILYIVPYVPNLIRVRPYNLIRHLVLRGHEVTVATVLAEPDEVMDVERLQQAGARVIAVPLPKWRSLANSLLAIPRGLPMQTRYSWQPALAGRIDVLLASGERYDVIHVEHLRGAEYGRYLLDGRQPGGALALPPVVWDSVDCISYLFRQSARSRGTGLKSRATAAFELAPTSRYERRAVETFDRVLVTSPVDRAELAKLGRAGRPDGKIEVVQNGVDLRYFTPGTAGRHADTIVISGKMSYHANVAMVKQLIGEIMPLVWAQRSGVKVQIVGKDPPPAIRAMGENPNVQVTGTVSDIRPYLQQATLAVAPITYGAGIQNKILEAMACATPVVASPRAISALLAVPGRDMLVAETASECADAILDLLNNPHRQREIGAAGRAYAEEHHDWVKITARLEEVYSAAIRGKIAEVSQK
jgi:glycosyltransferase involved in cell wall biosynthesis